MNKRRGLAARGYSRKPRQQRVPLLERVEDRVLMAVFTVTNTSDVANAVAGDGSLRGEILASNATTTANSIVFSLPTGLQTISLTSPLPAITDAVLIDGTSQAGFNASAPVPLIQILGNNPNNTAGSGITVSTGGVEIRDLIVDDFNGNGIVLNGGGDIVDGCYIGVDPTGQVLASNNGVGILVASPSNTIGATTTNPNVISGNTDGIQISGGNAAGNLVVHSYIGTDSNGTIKLRNTLSGIEINTANNTIGGVSTTGPLGLGNLISGNTLNGIYINQAGARANVIQGNYIGTKLGGMQSLSNSNDGIESDGEVNTLIGGTAAGAGNVISGNGSMGIFLNGGSSTGERIQGNLIGIAVNKITALGNASNGVDINGGNFETVGGSTLTGNAPQFGNVIAYNGPNNPLVAGVSILGGQNDGVLSNRIFSNGGLGIQLLGSNQGVRPPTILTAESGAGETQVTGTFSGNPSTNYRIQFFSSQVPNATGSGDGQNYLGDLDITTNSSGTMTFSTLLSGAVPVGYSLSSTATQGVLTTNNTSQFGPDVMVTQAILTDLSVSTSVSPVVPLLDQPVTYTLTVTNNGPDDATGVILTDTLPTNSTFITSSAGSVDSGVLTDDIGPLAANATVTVTITVKPNSTTTPFTNTAVVTGDDLDANLSNNTSVSTATVQNNADLSVILTPSSSTTPIGSPITYTLIVVNNGPSTSNNTVATVTFPASFSNIEVMPDQGTYSIDTNNVVTINLGIVPASSSSTTTLIASPTAVGTENTTASVTGTIEDPNLANNTTTVPVTVENAADLGVTIGASPEPVLVNNELLYTVTVVNNGPSVASEPVVLDTLPAGLTYVAADSSAGPNGAISFANGTVTATLSALSPGDTDTITIAVIPSISGQLTNTVTVGDPTQTSPIEIDPDLSNNSATISSLVSPADLSVTIINPADPLFIGNQVVYQVQVFNNGPADATNVILNDMFGAQATILSTSAGSVGVGNSITANLGTITSGSLVTVMIAVDPSASGTLLDTASVTSDEFDPDPNNNTSSSSNVISPVDVSVVVAASPNPTLVGHPISYVVTVTNSGPATATNVLFGTFLPAGILSGLSSSQGLVSQIALGTLEGNLGSIAPGVSATVVYTVTPQVVETAVNTVTVSSDNLDTNTGNNTSSISVAVINLPGTIQGSSSATIVPENAGSVTLTIERVGGSLGTVTANYATQDYTAIAGVNYVKTSGTVTFADGQTSATITIPVLDDHVINGDHAFFVVLTSPTGGATIGTPAILGVDVTNVDRDMVPPVVSGLIAIPDGSKLDGFVITFDKPMDPTRASLISNYAVFLAGAGSAQSVVPLAAAIYNAASNSVTLVPTSQLPSNRFYQIVANGSGVNPLIDLSGNVLSGSFGLTSNYDVFYGQGTKLVYNDSQSNVVTISLTGGGTLGIVRSIDGDATTVDLYQVVPHHSKLTGSVKKLNKHGSGHTSIGSIIGFGQFGNVKSSLTTPAFYVGSAPVTASSVQVSVPLTTSVSVESVTIPTVTHKKKTPKGPHHLKG